MSGQSEASAVNEPCTKKCFGSKKGAQKTLRGRGFQGRRMRVYYCDECKAYHLTKKVKVNRDDL